MIFPIIGSVIYLTKSLDFLYLFQTKEYRIDRIFNFIREEKILRVLYFRLPRLPAKSLRNFLIFINTAFGFFILHWTYISQQDFLDFGFVQNLFYYLIFTPIYAFATTLIGVMLTAVPVLIYRKYLIKKAAEKVRNSKTIFIGITGSYGKTTTKELLYQILSHQFNVAKTDKNYNSEVGVAISILKNLKANTQYFIAELGAYRTGEIKAACDLIQPKYGILTGIGNQHLSLFGSNQNLKEAKSELLQALPKDGIAYINMTIEDKEFFASKTKAKKVFYSIKNPLFEIKTNLIGRSNLENLLPCVALAIHLGMGKKQVDKILLHLQPVEARLSQKKGINGAIILDDSYNSNLEGFKAAIETAQKMPARKKYLLSRGLIELGAEKVKSYEKILETLRMSDLTMVTTDKLFKDLVTKDKVIYFAKESDLVESIRHITDKNSLIVVEGRFEPKTLQVLLAKNDLN